MTRAHIARTLACLTMAACMAASSLLAQKGLGGNVRAPDGSVVRGDNWLLLIGIDRYREWNSLQFPVSDVQKLKRILLDRYSFRPDRVVEVLNEKATKQGINEALEGMLDKLKAPDSVLIYYSGHGYKNPRTGVGYWIPHDASLNRYARTNWINNADVRGVIANYRCRHVLLISDSCFSGSILNATKGRVLDRGSRYYLNAYQRDARQVLTAGASEEVPDKSRFAYHLRRKLETNRQRYLDPEDIHAYVKRGVPDQLPLLGALKDAGHVQGGSYLFFLKPQKTVITGGEDTLEGKEGYKPVKDFGWIEVSLTPNNAALTIDGESVGAKRRLQKEVGEYELRATKRGHYTRIMRVRVSAFDTARASMSLKPLPRTGSIDVICSVAGAEVRLDGSRLGATRRGQALTQREVPVGRHTLTASRPGYEGWRRPVTVVEGRTETIVIVMKKLPEAAVAKPDRTRDTYENRRDGSTMILVPAGKFTMGGDDKPDGKPAHQVHVDAFYISKYEITNRQYKKFVDANPNWRKGRADESHASSLYLIDWEGDSYPPDKADHPVVNVSWFAAKAYCEWAGGRLPTEAEWEKAARGTDGRTYPWGSQWDRSKCNSASYWAKKDILDFDAWKEWYEAEGKNVGMATLPVGSFPAGASPYGVLDMAGNVWEWCSSIYPYRADDGREDAPAQGVLRGGSWHGIASCTRSAARVGLDPSDSNGLLGFRVVLSVRSSGSFLRP